MFSINGKSQSPPILFMGLNMRGESHIVALHFVEHNSAMSAERTGLSVILSRSLWNDIFIRVNFRPFWPTVLERRSQNWEPTLKLRECEDRSYQTLQWDVTTQFIRDKGLWYTAFCTPLKKSLSRIAQYRLSGLKVKQVSDRWPAGWSRIFSPCPRKKTNKET
jgi:hypothetical protein